MLTSTLIISLTEQMAVHGDVDVEIDGFELRDRLESIDFARISCLDYVVSEDIIKIVLES